MLILLLEISELRCKHLKRSSRASMSASEIADMVLFEMECVCQRERERVCVGFICRADELHLQPPQADFSAHSVLMKFDFGKEFIQECLGISDKDAQYTRVDGKSLPYHGETQYKMAQEALYAEQLAYSHQQQQHQQARQQCHLQHMNHQS
jgi:hypothetical protein